MAFQVLVSVPFWGPTTSLPLGWWDILYHCNLPTLLKLALMLASVVYKQDDPNKYSTQEDCNILEEKYVFKISHRMSRNVLWVSFTYTHFHNDISSLEISIYNCAKPLHADAAAEISIRKANQDSTSKLCRKELVIISHTLIYRFSLPLPKCLVI